MTLERKRGQRTRRPVTENDIIYMATGVDFFGCRMGSLSEDVYTDPETGEIARFGDVHWQQEGDAIAVEYNRRIVKRLREAWADSSVRERVRACAKGGETPWIEKFLDSAAEKYWRGEGPRPKDLPGRRFYGPNS